MGVFSQVRILSDILHLIHRVNMKFDVDKHPYIFVGICMLLLIIIPILVWIGLDWIFTTIGEF